MHRLVRVFLMIPSTCPNNTSMDGLFRDANVAYKQSKQSTFTNLNEVRIIKSYIYRSKSSIAYYCSRIEEYLDFNKEPIGLCT